MDKIMKTVNVMDVEDYFDLPKKEREHYGLYIKPVALPLNSGGWDEWVRRICKEYPIQGFIRERVLDYDNPIYAFLCDTRRNLRMFYYTLKRYFGNHYLPRFRRQVSPLHYKDVCDIITDGNLALISDFWHEEMVGSTIVDWNSDKKHKDFYKWMQKAIFWIEVDRVKLFYTLDEGHFNTIEEQEELAKKLEDGDTEILIDLIKYRGMFWT